MNGFILELHSDDPAGRYIAAYKCITSFVQSVAHTNIPASPFPPTQNDLVNTLTSLKNTSWGWLNDTAIQAEALPSSIVQLNGVVTSSITKLSDFKSKIPGAEQEIAQVAALLTGELLPERQSMQGLQGDLDQLYKTFTPNFNSLNRCIGDLNGAMNPLCQELPEVAAQCHAAESSVSPDQGKIQSLRKRLAELINETAAGHAWASILYPLSNNMTDAIAATKYLGTSWQSFGSEVDHVITILRLITTKPGSLGAIPLDNMSQAWKAVEGYMSEIVTGLRGAGHAS